MKKSVQKNNKFIFILISFLFLVFLFIGNISAEICEIKLESTCNLEGYHSVMGLSDLTNAHGELLEQDNYENVLCCDFGFGNTTCNGINKILGLSDITNAHAEIPSLNNYENDLCYDGVENCVAINADSACNFDLTEIITLSSDTNAHLGEYSTSLAKKICCEITSIGSLCETKENCEAGLICEDGQCIEPTTEVYWALPENPNNIIYDVQVDIDSTEILLMLKHSGLDEGTEVAFEIYEEDNSFPDFINDKIKVGGDAIKGTIDSEGNANVSWTITGGDLEEAGIGRWLDEDNNEDEFEFYFEVEDITSNELIITTIECELINSCGDYDNNISCGGDACEVSIEGLEGIDCDDPLIECGCQWDSDDEECNPFYTETEEFYCGYCGDRYVMLPWEECDDGNHEIKDGCSPNCKIEGGWECTGDPSDGEESVCTLVGNQEWCGDKIVNQGWEECDDENDINGDGCSAYCMVEDEGEWCGDNIPNQNWEECDEGNSGWDSDDCSASCQNNSEVDCEEFEIPSGFGTCSITEITDDNCDDGFITYSWEGNWSGVPEGSLYQKCINGGTRTVPCPAQIALPFFGLYNLIITCIVIALIYVFLSTKKKKSKKV